MHTLLAMVSLSGFIGGGWAFAGDGGEGRAPVPIEQGEPVLREIEIDVDSGAVRAASPLLGSGQRVGNGAGLIQEQVWSTIVRVPDAGWVRLRFDDVRLSAASDGGRESYLRITSLLDGYEQYLDTHSLAQWGNTSAYFNGGEVRVEIMASPGSPTTDRVWITGVQASSPINPASICGGVDDRVLSDDPRVGRLMPTECSAWLFGNHGNTFLGAGHCAPRGGEVVQFHVPLSTSTGVYQNPSPQDQYPVDMESVQNSNGVSLGNDWAFFGTFNNPETGLSPLEAQGASYRLATAPTPGDGRPIRITGYGTTMAPVSLTWSGVQKTHVGELLTAEGTILTYTTDTTGGNSGSAILDEDRNVVLGIHTNGGCGTSGGWNSGTSILNPLLQEALDNGVGIASARLIEAEVVGAKAMVSPEGGDLVGLVITNYYNQTLMGKPIMYVNLGTGFAPYATRRIDSNTFEGSLPAVSCESDIEYYFRLTDTDGNQMFYPWGGASAPMRAIALDGQSVYVQHDFETNPGWTISNSGVSDGAWIRMIPSSSTTNGGAQNDADGSGFCYATGGSNTDLDGGTTRLLSPIIDVTGMDDPVVSFAAWVNTSEGEKMEVEFSNTLGLLYIPVDEISDTNGWIMKRYRIQDYSALSPVFRVRLSISDQGADSLVEGGVDAFSITTQSCDEGVCVADLNNDYSTDFLDLSIFLSQFSIRGPIADLNHDGSFDFLDVSVFILSYSSGCP